MNTEKMLKELEELFAIVESEKSDIADKMFAIARIRNRSLQLRDYADTTEAKLKTTTNNN